MKVFITKYALSNGITENDAETTQTNGMIMVKFNNYNQYFHKPDWHLTIDEAKAQAEKMRVAKIKSLNKSIAKLESLTF